MFLLRFYSEKVFEVNTNYLSTSNVNYSKGKTSIVYKTFRRNLIADNVNTTTHYEL